MKNILDEIVAIKLDEIKKLRRDFTISRFSDSEFFDKETLDFHSALSGGNSISIISEIKKASPSKGIIREDFNHIAIAETYMNKGADAISVLTDKEFFMGDISFLKEIAKIKTIPILRKDFILDEYQIYEAKSNGADAILLISEILSASQIKELTNAAHENGLAVLLELHSESELDKMDLLENKIIGINNRDLTTFETSLLTVKRIAEKIKEDVTIVSESGFLHISDLNILKGAKVNAILVGEYLMRSKNIGGKLIELKENCNYEN